MDKNEVFNKLNITIEAYNDIKQDLVEQLTKELDSFTQDLVNENRFYSINNLNINDLINKNNNELLQDIDIRLENLVNVVIQAVEQELFNKVKGLFNNVD